MKNIKVYINNKLLGSYDRKKLELRILPIVGEQEVFGLKARGLFGPRHVEILDGDKVVFDNPNVLSYRVENYVTKPKLTKKLFITTI